MSTTVKNYVDYDVACRCFDHGRRATGVDEMIGMIFGMAGKQLQEIRLLDAGCGTGNYSQAFLKKGIGRLTLLDASSGMLSVASSKLGKAIVDENIDFVQHDLPSLPFTIKSFDVVTLINVIHQIDTQSDTGERQYPNLGECIGEAYRVLDDGGILLIKTKNQEQALHGCWYYPLIPTTVSKFQRKYIPIPDLIAMLRKSGFKHVSLMYHPGELSNIEEHVYKDVEGPLSANWRGTSSIWSMVEHDELEAAMERIKQMKDKGTLNSFYNQNDAFRQVFGQSVCVVARK